MVQDKYAIIYNKVKDTLESEQLYLRPDLSLVLLSRIIGTNTVYLSKAINRGFGASYTKMINHYRVNHVIDQARRSSQRIEILAGKYEFWSRSTFYDVFRQVTGMTPHKYMDKLKSEKG